MGGVLFYGVPERLEIALHCPHEWKYRLGVV